MEIKIIYVYDALCGWCYGFSKVIHTFFENHQSEFSFEVISGGMMTGDRVGPLRDIDTLESRFQNVLAEIKSNN